MDAAIAQGWQSNAETAGIASAGLLLSPLSGARVVLRRQILRGITIVVPVEAVAFFLVMAVLLDMLIMPRALGTRPMLHPRNALGVLHAVAGARHSTALEQIQGTIAVTLLVVLATLAHELGHALALRAAGATTITITIYGAGGSCRAQALATSPLALMWYSAAGPLVTLGVVLVLALTHGSVNAASYDVHAVLWLAAAIEADILALNLLPIVKRSDGGHFLRAGAALFGHGRPARIVLSCALCLLLGATFVALQSGQFSARLSAAVAILLCAALARAAWRADHGSRLSQGVPRPSAIGTAITWW